MKRILDSWPVTLVRLLLDGAFVLAVVLVFVAWRRGEPLLWMQGSSPPLVAVEAARSEVGAMRIEIVVPRECSFHVGLGSDHLLVQTTNPTQVSLSVRREESSARTVVSAVPATDGQR